MLVTSLQNKGQSSPIIHKPSNSISSKQAQGFTHIMISQTNSQNISLEESSPTAKVVFKIKTGDNGSLHKARRPQTSMKARPNQTGLNMTQQYSVDDKRKLIMSVMNESHNVNGATGGEKKKVIRPVIGVHIRKRTPDPTDHFTKIDIPESNEVTALKFHQSGGTFFKDKSALRKRDSLKTNKIIDMGIPVQEKRLNPAKAALLQEKIEVQIRTGHNNSTRYSPENGGNEKESPDAFPMKRYNFNKSQSLVESGKCSPEPNQQETSPDQTPSDVPKEGSLFRYFNKVNKAVKVSKSNQIFCRMRSSTETSPTHLKNSRDNSPSIDTKRVLSSTQTSLRIYSRSNTVQNRNQRSKGVIISKARPSTSCQTSRIESSIVGNKTPIEDNKTLVEPKTAAENNQYITTFVSKVQDFLKEKYEAENCWIQGLSHRNDETDHKIHEKSTSRQRDHSIPQKTEFNDSPGLQGSSPSPLKTTNTTFTKAMTAEQASKSLFEQSSTQFESSKLRCKSSERDQILVENLIREPGKDEIKSQDYINCLENSELANSEIISNLKNPITTMGKDEEQLGKSRKSVSQEVQKQEEIPNTINGLVKYARGKTQEIEKILLLPSNGDKKTKFHQSLSLAAIIEMRGGLSQRKINLSKSKLKTFKTERSQIKEVYKEIVKLEDTMREERKQNDKLIKSKEIALEKALIIRPGHLTQKELEFVRYYFQVNKEEGSFYKLDAILSRLRFYSLLAQEARAQFYKHAKYARFPAGSYVFQEGDFGDLMYVIIKGSVNVKARRVLENGESQVVTLVSLYDGSHFGDLAMVVQNNNNKDQKNKESRELQKLNITKTRLELEQSKEEETETDDVSPKSPQYTGRQSTSQSQALNEPLSQERNIPLYMLQQKRSASIECVEECEMLTLEREKYQTVVSEIMNRDMGTRVKLLNLIPFFKGIDMLSLVPFATNLRKMSFKFGQRIVKEGEPLMNFYIILKGKCHIAKEIIEDGRIGRDHYASKLRYFKFKDFEKSTFNQNTDPLRTMTESQTSQRSPMVEKIIEGATDDNPVKKELLRQRLKPFSFRSLEEAMNQFKKSDLPPDPNERAFNNDGIKDPNSKAAAKSGKPNYMARNHAVFKEFTVGHFFGFRPLFRRESDTKYKEMEESKARLSVIVSSVDAEVYVLTRDSLAYLPEGIKNILVDNVEKMPDFDDCDIEEGLWNHSEWKKFKLDIAKEIFDKPDPNLEKLKEFYKAY